MPSVYRRSPRFVLGSLLYESTAREFSRSIRDPGASRIWSPRSSSFNVLRSGLVPSFAGLRLKSEKSCYFTAFLFIRVLGSKSLFRIKRLIVSCIAIIARSSFAGVSFLLIWLKLHSNGEERSDWRRECVSNLRHEKNDFWIERQLTISAEQYCGLSKMRPDIGCKMRWSISD